MKVETEVQIVPLVAQFSTLGGSFLGNLYQGDSRAEIQGVILIDAYFAANAAGVIDTARPEDTIVNDQRTLCRAC
ncbi:MAG: hypothetical protein AAF652_04280 [Cyanobacteria bacterium P01_C01_bin.72]